MSDRMTFPDTVEEFMEQYNVVDTDGVYMSKGAELVPIFRMRQWFEQLPSAKPEQRWIPVSEKLPEASNFYIVTHKDFLVKLRWYSVFHSWEGQEEKQPIAWMPLPEPYVEGWEE